MESPLDRNVEWGVDNPGWTCEDVHMTNTAITVQPGSNGRFHVLEGRKVVRTFSNIMLAVNYAADIDTTDADLDTPDPITVRDMLPGEDPGNYAEYVNAMYEIASDMGVDVVRVAA